VGQYYRYYDSNGQSVYVETIDYTGSGQHQPMPRGAVPLDRDDYQAGLAAIEQASLLAEREADRVARELENAIPTPPDDGQGE